MEFQESIRFDENGLGFVSKSVPSLPMRVNVTAWLTGLDAVFDVFLLKPKQAEWHGLKENQRISEDIALKMGVTQIEARVQSSVPGKSAEFHISV